MDGEPDPIIRRCMHEVQGRLRFVDRGSNPSDCGMRGYDVETPEYLGDAKNALRLPSLVTGWRKPMEERLIQAGIPLE